MSTQKVSSLAFISSVISTIQKKWRPVEKLLDYAIAYICTYMPCQQMWTSLQPWPDSLCSKTEEV